MTFLELRTAILAEAKERVSIRGLVATGEDLGTLANRANRKIYNLGTKTNDNPWRRRSYSPYVVTAFGGYAWPDDFTNSLVPAGPEGNPPAYYAETVDKICYLEWLDGETWRDLLPMEHPGDRASVDRVSSSTATKPERWYIDDGGSLYVSPGIAGITLRATYLPQYRNLVLVTDDAELLLGGKCPDHHDLVLYAALRMLSAKDENQRTPWDGEYKEAKDLFVASLQRDQLMKTRRVRRARHY